MLVIPEVNVMLATLLPPEFVPDAMKFQAPPPATASNAGGLPAPVDVRT